MKPAFLISTLALLTALPLAAAEKKPAKKNVPSKPVPATPPPPAAEAKLSATPTPKPPAPPAPLREQLAAVCSDFEAAWQKATTSGTVEEFLALLDREDNRRVEEVAKTMPGLNVRGFGVVQLMQTVLDVYREDALGTWEVTIAGGAASPIVPGGVAKLPVPALFSVPPQPTFGSEDSIVGVENLGFSTSAGIGPARVSVIESSDGRQFFTEMTLDNAGIETARVFPCEVKLWQSMGDFAGKTAAILGVRVSADLHPTFTENTEAFRDDKSRKIWMNTFLTTARLKVATDAAPGEITGTAVVVTHGPQNGVVVDQELTVPFTLRVLDKVAPTRREVLSIWLEGVQVWKKLAVITNPEVRGKAEVEARRICADTRERLAGLAKFAEPPVAELIAQLIKHPRLDGTAVAAEKTN